MNGQVKEYIEKYPQKIIVMYERLRSLIYESASTEPEEKLWAKLPSYYIGENFVRLIPFKDHVNIEAVSLKKYAGELSGYKFTPKGMLQIYLSQEIPSDVLSRIFKEILDK